MRGRVAHLAEVCLSGRLVNGVLLKSGAELLRRGLAALLLIAMLGLTLKLAGKGVGPPAFEAADAASTFPAPALSNEAARSAFLTKYSGEEVLLARVFDRYRHTAFRVDEQAGLRGLKLLDRLDLDAIYLLERHPEEFERLALSLDEDAAADLLLHWRTYFGLKLSDDVDRAHLIEDIARLPKRHRRWAAKYPQSLPFILADGERMCDMLIRNEDNLAALADALLMLDFVSLKDGPGSLRKALDALDRFPTLALEAFRKRGPEGLALVVSYGELFKAIGSSLALDDALILVQVNCEYVNELLRSRTVSQVAAQLRHIHALGLSEAVGSSINGLRLAVEYGAEGEAALASAGGDAADVAYDDFEDVELRRQAVRALAQHGVMAASMLSKYANDSEFQTILRRHGPKVIPPIARSDVAPNVLLMLQQKPRKSLTESLAEQVISWSGDNGQATIRTIARDGLGRVAELNDTDLQFYQFLPFYDLLHLGKVVVDGHSPTSGEMAWAAIDAAFVVWDVLTLAGAQPEATVAGEALRGEVKSATRQAAESSGRALVDRAKVAAAGSLTNEGTKMGAAAGQRFARWWTVRTAGGLYQLLRQTPQALGKMSFEQVTNLAAPAFRRAGLKLSSWVPLRFFKNGASVVLKIPAERWVKYVGVNVAQAGVGVLAMHKMEEYLASRRGASP